MKLYAFAFPLLLLVAGQDGCDNQRANYQEAEKVDEQQQRYVTNQPAPVFQFSLERHIMVELYKARNQAVGTYSYVQSPYTGKVLWACPSIGFPIPANTQLTNPQAMIHYQGVAALPQAEPNGLYSSPSTSGTYVMCLNEDGEISPRYEERDVTASLQPLHEVGGELVPVAGSKPSLSISLKK